MTVAHVGPILGYVTAAEAAVWLEWQEGERPPVLADATRRVEPTVLATHSSAGVYQLSGLQPGKVYRFQFEPKLVNAASEISVRTPGTEPSAGAIALVSCNNWEEYRRNPLLTRAIWADLLDQIADGQVTMVIHCGDQVYADPVWDRVTDEFREWQAKKVMPESKRKQWCAQHRQAWIEAYRELYRTSWNPQSPVAPVLAAAPNLMIWDDHDIHDGYGSRKSDLWLPHSEVAAAARQVYLEYQHAHNPQQPQLPKALPWSLHLPGIELFALDLRSERDYDADPSVILGAAQRDALQAWKAGRPAHDPNDPATFGAITFVVASTPPVLFGRTNSPLYVLVPDLIDDLYDQWVSAANIRDLEWFLYFCESLRSEKNTRVIVLSGDIHIHHLVTTRRRGSSQPILHQVTSSPIGNTPVAGALRKIVYGKGMLAGPVHDGSAFEGELDKRTLLSGRGYAIVAWRWTNAQPQVDVTWRLLDEVGTIQPHGPFPLVT